MKTPRYLFGFDSSGKPVRVVDLSELTPEEAGEAACAPVLDSEPTPEDLALFDKFKEKNPWLFDPVDEP